MSESDQPARPRQLTMAAGFVIGGSVLLVLTAFDALTSLNTLDKRDKITQLITSPNGGGLGLTLNEALSGYRVGLMVAAACAAAAAVLGVYALQRNRGARLALSILAVPILLTAPLTGGLVGALVAAATLMLWSGPARDWFAGRPVREVGPPRPRQSHPGPWEETMPPPHERNRGREQDPRPRDQQSPAGDPPPTIEGPAASSLTTVGSSTEPGATAGFGARPVQLADPPSPPWLPPPYAELARGTAVPVTVKIACVLTWVFSGLVALLYAGMLVVLVFAQDRVVQVVLKAPEWQRSHLQQDMLGPILWIGCLMFLGWALGACLLAWFTWRRHNWARWLLTVSAAATMVAALFAFPAGILHQLAAALTIAGLFSTAARTWFSGRVPMSGPPPGLPGPPPPGHVSSGSSEHRADQGQSPSPGGRPPVW